MRRHYPLNPATGVEDVAFLPWTDGNPVAGIDGSFPGQALVTDMEAELVNVVELSGMTLDGADKTQLYQAILRANVITTAVTKTVHGTSPDFADLNAAMAWLSRYRISTTGSVTFNIRAGKFTYTGSAASVLLRHPDMARVSVQGAAMTGAFPLYTALSITGNSAGQRSSDRTANLSNARALWATELTFAGGAQLTLSGDLAGFRNILVTGDGASGGNVITARGGMQYWMNIAAGIGGGRGISTAGAVIFLDGGLLTFGHLGNGYSGELASLQSVPVGAAANIIAVGNGSSGVTAASGSYVGYNGSGSILASGNVDFGVSALNNGSINCGAAPRADNNTTGFNAQNSSGIGCDGGTANANTNWGASAVTGAYVTAANLAGSANGLGPVTALYGSVIYAVGSTIAGTASPTYNTTGNGNSYIIK